MGSVTLVWLKEGSFRVVHCGIKSEKLYRKKGKPKETNPTQTSQMMAVGKRRIKDPTGV